MKTRLRLILPAITAATLLGAAPSSADNSQNASCPDPSSGWLLVPVAVYPGGAQKDKNEDGLVCAKSVTGPTKDNNNPDLTDDILAT
jgi:hypothetical protein